MVVLVGMAATSKEGVDEDRLVGGWLEDEEDGGRREGGTGLGENIDGTREKRLADCRLTRERRKRDGEDSAAEVRGLECAAAKVQRLIEKSTQFQAYCRCD